MEPKSSFAIPCPVAKQANSIYTRTTTDSTHCEHCDRKVEILAGKSLLEINAFIKANPGSCIVIGGKLNR
jgi:hypothetical protein